jgi:hypothetical protein
MHTVPRVGIRPRGRYVNIDADDAEIGYLTVTTRGKIDRVWAYDLSDRWLVDLVYDCYRAVLASVTVATSDGWSHPTSESSR